VKIEVAQNYLEIKKNRAKVSFTINRNLDHEGQTLIKNRNFIEFITGGTSQLTELQ